MRLTSVSLVLPALALGLSTGCDPSPFDPVTSPGQASDETDGGEAPDPQADGDAPDGDDDGAPAPTAGDGTDPSDAYRIHGRTLVAASVGTTPPRELADAPSVALGESCPFDPTSEPCTADACWNDPASLECKAIIEAYCEDHPQDPGCGAEPPPPDGKEPPPDGKEPDGETWACAEDPTWPPCEVCLDPTATDEECGAAWNAQCNEHPEDVWCENDEPEAVYQPTSLSVLVHKVEFSADAQGCMDPVLVGEPDTPRYVDFADGPELVDAVLPPDGAYGCVIITMSDHIQWSVEGDSPCAGDHVQDVSGEDGVEEIVRLHLSTAGDSGHYGGDAFEAPGLFLGGALEVGEGIVGSDFIVSFPEGVWYRPDSDRVCEIMKPQFAFQTHYAG